MCEKTVARGPGRLEETCDGSVRASERLAAALPGIAAAAIEAAAHIAFLIEVGVTHLPLAYLIGAILSLIAARVWGRLGRIGNRIAWATLIVVPAAFSVIDGVMRGWLLFVSYPGLMVLLDRFSGAENRTRAHAVSAGVTFLLIGLCSSIAMEITPLLWLGLAAIVVRAFIRKPATQALANTEAEPSRDGKVGIARSDLLTAAILSGLIAWTGKTIDFLFLDALWETVRDPTSLVSCLAVVLCAARLAEVALRRFRSAGLRIFGRTAGLVFFPIGSLVCLTVASLFGLVLGSGIELLVSLIVARLTDAVLRGAPLEEAFAALFAPAGRVRASRAVRLVTGPAALLGVGAASLALTFVIAGSLGTIWLPVALIPIQLIAWVAAGRCRMRYRRLIHRALGPRHGVRIIESPIDILEKALASASPGELGFALDVLEQIDPVLLESFLPTLLQAPDPLVRVVALERIDTLQLISTRHRLAAIAADDEDESVRMMAGFILERFAEVEHSVPDPDCLRASAAGRDPAQRLEAARQIGRIDPDDARETLTKLLWDPDPMVRRATILTVGETGDTSLVPLLLDHLGSGMTSKAAATALVKLGPSLLKRDTVVQALRTRPVIRRRLIDIIARIGGPEAERRLMAMEGDPDRIIRRKVLYALTRLGYQATREQVPLIKSRIEKMVDLLTWNLATCRDVTKLANSADLIAALSHERDQAFETLCAMLAMICDRQVVHMIHDHLLLGEGKADFLREIVRETLPDDVEMWVIPFLEPPVAALDLLSNRYPHLPMTGFERLVDILTRGPEETTPLTRARAVELMASLASFRVTVPLIALLESPYPLEAESAARAVRNADPEAWPSINGRLSRDRQAYLTELFPDEAGQSRLIQIEKIPILARCPLFASIPEAVLAEIVPNITELRMGSDKRLFRAGDKGEELYVVVEGGVRVHDDQTTYAVMGPGEMFGEIAVVDTGVRTLHATTEGETRLLRLDQAQMLDFMADYMEIIAPVTRVIAERLARG